MPLTIQQLRPEDSASVGRLWERANERRRREVGLEPLGPSIDVLDRPGAFGVGGYDDGVLTAIALALPALADDARSSRLVPGLVHISTVATDPASWGRGHGRLMMRAIMLQASRRGYARAQLWTHASNAGARHLYERVGFVLTGRTRTDDHGEPIVHYMRDVPTPKLHSRWAARMICLDPADRVLLVHWRDSHDGWQLWEPPGGGIEPGESAQSAVLREWAEETGLPAPDIVIGSRTVARDLQWNGARNVCDEEFFLGRTRDAGGAVMDEESEHGDQVYLGHAWVPWSELDELPDPVVPDVVAILRMLDPSGPWADGV